MKTGQYNNSMEIVKFSESTVIDQQFWKANRNSGIPIRKGKTAISNTGIKSQAIEVSTFIDCDCQSIFNSPQESNIKNMNFQNVNSLNNQANVLSDNLLPMSSDNSQFPISWRIYCAIVLLKCYRSCPYDGVDSRANSGTERKGFNGTPLWSPCKWSSWWRVFTRIRRWWCE